MLELLFSEPLIFCVIFGGLILAIGIHEAAHCFMADYLGDPTPRSLGRLTLNPLAHLDPLGTLVILITGRFGWGKPAPFDPYNLRDPRRDTALIALAGPVSNLIIAVGLSFLFHSLSNLSLLNILSGLIQLNVNLAIFNLLPIPPLDGSKIVGLQAGQNSHWVLLLFLLPIFGGISLASLVVSPIAQTIIHVLLTPLYN